MRALPHGIRRAFRLASGRSPVDEEIDREIDDEVAFHLEMRAAELAARGMSTDAARAEARRRFGDTRHWSRAMGAIDREQAAGRRRTEWLDDLRQDLRFGLRSALRAPLFSALAVVTLALGIGANAAVFGVVKSVLLDALPYADADRLVRLYGRTLDGSIERAPVSAGTYTDLAARQHSFASLAAFEGQTRDAIVTADGDPRVVRDLWVEPALFRVLGVAPVLGRPLRDEDAASDTIHTVLITYGAWQRLLGGDPGVLSRTVTINGIPRALAGVLPRDFVGPVGDVDFYFPLNLAPMLRDPVSARRRQNFGVIARLRPGATADGARREVVALAADLAREYPQYNGNIGVTAVPVREDMVGDTRTPLLVLMASAGLVLLITCANLAGALLSRTISRRKEFAVRVSLGAGRGRLVRQLLTESVLLALAGGVAGLVLATAGLLLLRGLAAHALPAYARLSLDPGALAFTFVLAVLTGVGFGLAPALSVSRADVQRTLRDESRGSSESRRSRRLRGLLVAGQIALCASLLVGAGLLARSLWAMTATPLGFRPEGVLAAAVELPRARYGNSAEARVRFMAQLEERLRALPGVTAVASAGDVPTRMGGRNSFVVEGAPPPPVDAQPIAFYATVGDDYFRTLGIPLRAGRTFGPSERLGGQDAVIVSEGLARRYFPGGAAVGSRIRLNPDPAAPDFEVVGVAADVRNDPARPDQEPVLYVSNRQAPFNGPVFLLRTQGDPASLVNALRRELAAVDPGAPLRDASPLPALLAEGLAGRRLPVVLMTAFGTLALILASVGVYAMFAAMAAAREREFGVRMALGSSRRAIATLVLRQGAVWIGAGLVGGAFGVVAVARLLGNLLYGVPPFDPVSLGAAALALVVCATVALLVPVRRATHVDPISALR